MRATLGWPLVLVGAINLVPGIVLLLVPAGVVGLLSLPLMSTRLFPKTVLGLAGVGTAHVVG